MKILLINPPSKFLIDDNVFPTLGLLYLAAYLKKAGHKDISLLDLNGGHAMPEVIDADIVGFYSNTPQFPVAVTLRDKLAKINKNKKAIYVIGGPHVSGRPQDSEGHFDYTVVGEGERAFLDIADAFARGERLKERIVKYKYMKDLDTIPFPDRELVNIKSYQYLIKGHPATTVITSRGCPYGCAFCANNAWGKTLRMRSPGNIIEELKLLIEQLNS